MNDTHHTEQKHALMTTTNCTSVQHLYDICSVNIDWQHH